jgi:hypothetical protein
MYFSYAATSRSYHVSVAMLRIAIASGATGSITNFVIMFSSSFFLPLWQRQDLNPQSLSLKQVFYRCAARGRIFSRVPPFYERDVSDLDP